jgi:sucrose-phosphate synthase
MPEKDSQALYIVLVSVHGLIRGQDLELGRDADTGGQTKYVVELARALAERPDVEQVDLLTRRVVDPRVSSDYAEPEEGLGGKARILRIDCGPEEYVRKEELWDHLDVFVDNALSRLRQERRLPNLIHGHYADAGYVGVRLARVLGLPLVQTGHSLGRVKRRRLLATGMKRDQIESRYQMARRIDAEEETLAAADLVVVSTANEIDEQYGLYDFYQPEHMAVVPPGTDLERFHPPGPNDAEPAIAGEIRRFLREPDKPMILALSRPDERKNVATLVEAYGETAALQEAANLVLVTGNRDDLRDMDPGPQSVLQELLLLIDYHDLYGRVAYPKHHKADEVPEIYRAASASGGVFINPALTEPFGLTLLEAAASGMPLVATEDGGPQDIIGNCRNGLLIDPLDREAMAAALLRVLTQAEERREFIANGLEGVQRHYSWPAHAERYLSLIRPLVERSAPPPRTRLSRRAMRYHDRAVFSDLDQTLLGDPASLKDFTEFVRRNRKCASFGIATGRRLDSALKVMKRYRIPMPDVLITDVGTEIHYAPELTADQAWARHIDHQWQPKALRRVLDELPGLQLQPKSLRSRFKLSYFIDPTKAPGLDELYRLLHQEDQTANLIMSFGQFLDVLPVRASKGFALRYFSDQWDIPLEHILVAGGSGADEDMMRGNTLAVVVANRHHEELSQLTDIERIYFAQEPYAKGILEAIDHYDFYGECRLPEPEPDAD